MEREKKWDMTKILNRIVDLVELAIAFALVAGILVLFVQMIHEYGSLAIRYGNYDFSSFLSKALNLIIGIEFTRMLCRHTPDTIIEVLMFATARQIIIAHSSVLDTFLGVVSIGILFVVRKHMLPDKNIGYEVGYLHRFNHKLFSRRGIVNRHAEVGNNDIEQQHKDVKD